MRIHFIILSALLIILVECSNDKLDKNLHFFSELLKHILKEFAGEESASTSNNGQLSMSYKANAKLLSIIQEKIANEFLHGQCHAEMKIDFYEILTESGLSDLHLEKEEISAQGNIQMIKLLLSFAIRLISIIGEYELNQESKEIKFSNFLIAYNCLDNIMPNTEKRSFR